MQLNHSCLTYHQFPHCTRARLRHNIFIGQYYIIIRHYSRDNGSLVLGQTKELKVHTLYSGSQSSILHLRGEADKKLLGVTSALVPYSWFRKSEVEPQIFHD